MVNDPREPRNNIARLVQHFDVFTNKHKLTPALTQRDGDINSNANRIANFLFLNNKVYGLGINVAGGNAKAAIFTRMGVTTPFNEPNNPADPTWTQTTNGVSANSSRADADLPLFIAYKGDIYYLTGTRIAQFTPDTTQVTTGLTYTTASNGIVHPKDDILYFGYDNYIASKNGAGSWNLTALTLPTNQVITSICEYGNYLAIACRPTTDGTSSNLNSTVYLWDRDSSLATLSEKIDWGVGNLTLIEELDGYLIGVSFLGTTGSYTTSKARTIFKYYAGAGGTVVFQELTGFSQAPTITSGPGPAAAPSAGPSFKQKYNNRIYFSASIPIVTTGYFGVWSIGRSSTNVPFAVAHDRIARTAYATALSIYGILLLGDYLFFSYNTGNDVFYTDKTNHGVTYDNTSVYETTINPNMPPGDRIQKKQLMSVGAMYEALPAAGQVVVKYRVDGGSWNTIFTETTDNAVSTEPYTNASGTQFTSGKEYEFRIESLGGSEITALIYKYNVLASNV